MQRDRFLIRHPLCEIVALENLFDSRLRSKLHKIRRREFIHPFAVETDLRFIRIEKTEHLRLVSFRVGVDLLARKRRPRHVLSRRIADHPGKVPDQKNDRVAEILERSQLSDHNRVADVNIGRGRIQAELHAERLPCFCRAFELRLEIFFTDQIHRAFF